MSFATKSKFFREYLAIPLLVIVIIGGWFGYLEYNYRTNNSSKIILEKFIKNLDQEEINSQLVSKNFINNYKNGANLEELKTLNQNNSLIIGNFKYSPSHTGATIDINYKQDPEETSVIYLEKQGDWYLQGYSWRVYRIENFKVGVLENVEKQTDEFFNDIKNGLENLFK